MFKDHMKNKMSFQHVSLSLKGPSFQRSVICPQKKIFCPLKIFFFNYFQSAKIDTDKMIKVQILSGIFF